MDETKTTAFRRKCEQVAASACMDVEFYEDLGRGQEVFEDDGTLHVKNRKERACFDVSGSQTLCGTKQNFNTRLILGMLGLEVTDATLVEESDDQDEEEYCDSCGRHCGCKQW